MVQSATRLLLAVPAAGADRRSVVLDDPRLRVGGALAIAVEDGLLVVRRFDPVVAVASRATLRPDTTPPPPARWRCTCSATARRCA